MQTIKGCTKYRKMIANPQVALAIPDPQDPYRDMQNRVRVVERMSEGGRKHIQKLAIIYTGKPGSFPPAQERGICKILPESVDLYL